MANVLTDIEPLYFMVTGQFPIHRFCHTYVGATLTAAATVLVFLGARRLAKVCWLPNLFGWQELHLRPVAVGAAVGTYSHVVLDSIMHSDIRPYAPFGDGNHLYRALDLEQLHLLCLGAGLMGALILAIRHFARKKNAR